MTEQEQQRTIGPSRRVRLDKFDSRRFDRGRGRLTELLWLLIGGVFVRSWQPSSRLRVWALKAFGARIGAGVVIKPHVLVKFPWRLSIGDHSWIGEEVWIDNLAEVSIGAHCCVSQGAYLCTGNHDWRKESFDLITAPITLKDGAWVCAMARVAPGVTIGEGAIVGFGTVLTCDLGANKRILAGSPSLLPNLTAR